MAVYFIVLLLSGNLFEDMYITLDYDMDLKCILGGWISFY